MEQRSTRGQAQTPHQPGRDPGFQGLQMQEAAVLGPWGCCSCAESASYKEGHPMGSLYCEVSPTSEGHSLVISTEVTSVLLWNSDIFLLVTVGETEVERLTVALCIRR